MKKFSRPQGGVKMSGNRTRNTGMPIVNILPDVAKVAADNKSRDIINHEGKGLDSFSLDDTKLD